MGVNEHGQQVGDEVAGWEPRPFPAPVGLDGRYVRLEPLSADHAEPLFEALGGPEDAPLWTYRPAEQPTDVAAMARTVATLAADTSSLTLAVVPLDGRERAEGLTTYSRVDPGNGVLEVSGVLFSRRLQRTRAATEALHLVLRQAIDEWGYRRVEWKCDALNEPSRRAATRLGLAHEGRFRRHMVLKGRSRDTDWFALTEAEWPAVRAAHEQWLDPGNFDDDGRQRTSLSERTAPRG